MTENVVKGAAPIAGQKTRWTFKNETVFTLLMALISGYAFISALSFPFGSGLYPMVIAIISFGLAVGQVILELHQRVLIKEAMDVRVEESQKGKPAMRRAVKFLAWFLGLYAGIWLLGYQVIMLPWLVAFMLFEGHIKWWRILLIAAIAAALILWVMPDILQMDAPKGVLQDWLGR